MLRHVAVLNHVPETAVCYHKEGKVHGYQVPRELPTTGYLEPATRYRLLGTGYSEGRKGLKEAELAAAWNPPVSRVRGHQVPPSKHGKRRAQATPGHRRTSSVSQPRGLAG